MTSCWLFLNNWFSIFQKNLLLSIIFRVATFKMKTKRPFETSVRVCQTVCAWCNIPQYRNPERYKTLRTSYWSNKPRRIVKTERKNNKMQQSDVYYQHCLNMFRASLCPSSWEQRPCVTACGVLIWFCWMLLVAVVGRCVVGCEHCEVTFTCWDRSW